MSKLKQHFAKKVQTKLAMKAVEGISPKRLEVLAEVNAIGTKVKTNFLEFKKTWEEKLALKQFKIECENKILSCDIKRR